DRRPAPAEGADLAGHVPRRQLHPLDGRADLDRNADLRRPAGAPRSTDPVHLMNAHVFLEGPAETGPAISPLNDGASTSEIAAAGQWTRIWRIFSRYKGTVAAGHV